MELSVMTFAVMMERLTGKMNAKRLCEMATAADLKTLDLMDVELKLYGKTKLKQAMSEAGLSCECLIASAPFVSAGNKVEKAISKALSEAAISDILGVTEDRVAELKEQAFKKLRSVQK